MKCVTIKLSKIILITSESDFIGKYISKKFLNKKYRIINYDLIKKKSLKHYRNYKFIKGDIINCKKIRKIFSKIDYVFHLDYIKKEYIKLER